jgi:hypothetical protein
MRRPRETAADTEPSVFHDSVSAAVRGLRLRLEENYRKTYPDLADIIHLFVKLAAKIKPDITTPQNHQLLKSYEAFAKGWQRWDRFRLAGTLRWLFIFFPKTTILPFRRQKAHKQQPIPGFPNIIKSAVLK